MDCNSNIDRASRAVLYRNKDDDLMCEVTFNNGNKIHGKVLNINPFPNDTCLVSDNEHTWNVEIKWEYNQDAL